MSRRLTDGLSFRALRDIDHIVHEDVFGCAVTLPGFNEFINGLPDVLAARQLRRLLSAMRRARSLGRPVIWAMGAHSIKCGLTPWLLALGRSGYLTALALNGACVIHDLEFALAAETSEDVAGHLGDGSFGFADEPGMLIGKAVGQSEGRGFGEVVCDLLSGDEIERKDLSLLAGCARQSIPVTVHAALGTDTIHFHPELSWAKLGSCLERDFERYVDIVAGLDGGGVYINVGSAVVLPEVFLKAVTVLRNLGNRLEGFTTANLDMIQHYRPRENVLKRPGGQAVALTGHHEIMIPLIACALLSSPQDGVGE